MDNIQTLEDMYNSAGFQAWDSDNRSCGGCGIILNDSKRFDRICKAAEFGSEGSTHNEIIDDWNEYLEILCDDIPETDYDAISIEILKCYNWHDNNGSLNREIG